MADLRAALLGYGYWGPNLARNVQSEPMLGQGRLVVGRLVSSGHFERVVSDDPLTLLGFTG